MTKALIRKILPKTIREYFAYFRDQSYRRIALLPISSSGLSQEGIPFVRLHNLIFYGYPPTKAQRYIYRHFVDKRIRTKVNESAFNVAWEIVWRYIGSESSKLDDIVEEGKYYDLKQRDTVIEVGAYIGYYAMRMAEIVGETGRVVAIEPVEENLKLLRKNIETNSFRNIIIVPKAVWKEKTTLSLFRSDRQSASFFKNIVQSENKMKVQCDMFDNILKELDILDVNFIRIQINGAEIEALEGMTEILKKKPKLLIATTYERMGKPSHEIICPALHEKGYATLVKSGDVFAWKS